MDQPTRTCTKCGETKPLKEGFYYRAKNKGRRPFWTQECRECNRAYLRGHTKRKRDYVAAYKVERGCMDCGLQHPLAAIFDLDHRPGESKVLKLSQLAAVGTMAQVIAECEKCDVVCANCHRIRTEQRKADGMPGASNMDWDLLRPPAPPEPSLLDFLDMAG